MAKYRQTQNAWVLLLLLFAGGLAGNAVAYVLPPGLGILKALYTIGLQPAALDIHFFKLTFGLTMDAGILTVLGLLAGYLLYRKV